MVSIDSGLWASLVLTIYPVVILGMFIDRYFLLEKRLLQSMIDKTNKNKRCCICNRPMVIVKEQNHDER